jgi:hypothetical protein
MNEKTFRALVEAGAIKRVRVVADGARFHIEADTPTATHVLQTTQGKPRTWGTLDAAAKWLRGLGIGAMELDVARWQPLQRRLKI